MDINRHPAHPGHGAEPAYTGHDVVDERQNKIGTIIDVVYDDATDPARAGAADEPTWLVVDPGLLQAAHYVPVAGSYRSDDGVVVVPWDKAWVKSAPKAKRDHVPSHDARTELRAHYSAV